MTIPMQWVSALSKRPSLEAAVAEVVQRAQTSLSSPADLGFVFISSAFASEFSRLLPLLQDHLPNLPLIGCGGGGVIGMTSPTIATEVEEEAALVLTLASLPGVQVRTFHLLTDELPDLDSPPDAWMELTESTASENPQFILLADPFSGHINDLLQGLDYAFPNSHIVGGLAGATPNSGSTGLFCDTKLHREGVVGVALSGNIVLDTIVAQGCRPIGQPYIVTEGERNIVLGLQEQPLPSARSYSAATVSHKRTPLEMLQDLVQTLSDEERSLAQRALFVGIAQNEFKQTLEAGDFLIRQLLGVDPQVGAIAIGDRIRPGQRIQFHLRDARASADDLEALLRRYCQEKSGPAGAGALMFSCVGRGEGLYNEPNFDSDLFHRYLPGVPLSGFFCNGEIGPVGNSTFLHGYTSVFGIIRPQT